MNESNLIMHWPISTLEAILRSNLSDNCLLCKFFKITEIMSMLDPTLIKRQSYMLSHRGVLKISSCKVLQKTSEKNDCEDVIFNKHEGLRQHWMSFSLKIFPNSCKAANNYIKKLFDVMRFAMVFNIQNDTILENNELIETILTKILMKVCIHV